MLGAILALVTHAFVWLGAVESQFVGRRQLVIGRGRPARCARPFQESSDLQLVWKCRLIALLSHRRLS